MKANLFGKLFIFMCIIWGHFFVLLMKVSVYHFEWMKRHLHCLLVCMLVICLSIAYGVKCWICYLMRASQSLQHISTLNQLKLFPPSSLSHPNVNVYPIHKLKAYIKWPGSRMCTKTDMFPFIWTNMIPKWIIISSFFFTLLMLLISSSGDELRVQYKWLFWI